VLIAFHKPYGVLSQFTPDGSPNRTLAEFGFPKNVYPLGRLDADSEGLLLLSDEPGLNTRLLDPKSSPKEFPSVIIKPFPVAPGFWNPNPNSLHEIPPSVSAKPFLTAGSLSN